MRSHLAAAIGADKAEAVACGTLARAKEAMGFLPR